MHAAPRTRPTGHYSLAEAAGGSSTLEASVLVRKRSEWAMHERQSARTFELLELHLALGHVALGGLGAQLRLPDEQCANKQNIKANTLQHSTHSCTMQTYRYNSKLARITGRF